jgi:hypothetical protein
MKIYIFTFLLFISLSTISFAKTGTDTITTWQLYKDAKLMFTSNVFEKVHTVTIKSNDTFKALKLSIFTDTPSSNISRKLLFKINGKLMHTYIGKLKSGSEAITITNQELKNIIGLHTNKVFTVEYTDDISTNATLLFKIALTGE